MRTIRSFLILGLSLAMAGDAWAKPLERVPQDGTLQQALQRVSNGGVIEIDDGTYAAPASGFRIRNMSVTVRAVPGALIQALDRRQVCVVGDREADAAVQVQAFAQGDGEEEHDARAEEQPQRRRIAGPTTLEIVRRQAARPEQERRQCPPES